MLNRLYKKMTSVTNKRRIKSPANEIVKADIDDIKDINLTIVSDVDLINKSRNDAPYDKIESEHDILMKYFYDHMDTLADDLIFTILQYLQWFEFFDHLSKMLKYSNAISKLVNDKNNRIFKWYWTEYIDYDLPAYVFYSGSYYDSLYHEHRIYLNGGCVESKLLNYFAIFNRVIGLTILLHKYIYDINIVASAYIATKHATIKDIICQFYSKDDIEAHFERQRIEGIAALERRYRS